MGILKILAVSGALALSASGAAFAADLGMPEIPTVDGASAVEPELGTNWYLRGDIGYTATTVNFDVAVGSSDSVSDDGWTWIAGGGIGYDFGWFRSDITLDYLAQRDIGFSTVNALCVDDSAGPCVNNHNTGVNAVPLMWNAYFDLGTWNGFTPYVGAGAGAALVNWQNVISSSPGVAPGVLNIASDDWRFAWSLMAGFSYNLNQNLALDFGYRFLDITDGKLTRSFVTSASTNRGSIDYSDFYSHQVRVGFRWTID